MSWVCVCVFSYFYGGMLTMLRTCTHTWKSAIKPKKASLIITYWIRYRALGHIVQNTSAHIWYEIRQTNVFLFYFFSFQSKALKMDCAPILLMLLSRLKNVFDVDFTAAVIRYCYPFVIKFEWTHCTRNFICTNLDFKSNFFGCFFVSFVVCSHSWRSLLWVLMQKISTTMSILITHSHPPARTHTHIHTALVS